MPAAAAKVLTGWRLKLLDFSDVQIWASERVSLQKDPTGELVDILRGDEARTPFILAAVVAIEAPDFEFGGATSQRYAKEMWFNRLQSYVSGTLSPWAVCQSVPLLEVAFDFPEWLGDMYNACDWVEKHWTRRDAPIVEEEARKLIEEYQAG